MLRDNTNLWGSDRIQPKGQDRISNMFSCAHGFQITLQSSVDIGSNKSTWKRISASPLPTDDAALLASFGSDICCALGLFVSQAYWSVWDDAVTVSKSSSLSVNTGSTPLGFKRSTSMSAVKMESFFSQVPSINTHYFFNAVTNCVCVCVFF